MFLRSGVGNVSIKKYGDTFRVCVFKSSAPFEPRASPVSREKLGRCKGEKTESSVARAKRSVWELAMCNEWEYFATFTLDGEKYDRFNLERFRKDFSQWLRDERKRTGEEIRYLLVPEKHANGAWHMHGLFSGCNTQLEVFSPPAPLDLVRGGFLNWPRYQRKFGFCSMAPVRDHDAVAGYITKYVTKAFRGEEGRDHSEELGGHLFYASQGLKRAEFCYQGSLIKPIPGECFENEYVKIYQMDYFPMEYIDPVCFPLGVVPDVCLEGDNNNS